MSKRKAPEPVGSKAAGKRRADAPSVEDDATDDLVNSLLEGDDVGDDIGIDQLLDSEADGDDVGGDVPLSDFDCPPEDLLGLQQQDSSFTPAPDDDEVGELPDDLAETQLVEPEQVDLSKHTLTLPQARCVARLLAQNGSLAEIRFEDHSLPVGDMKDSEELEWDSEEYTDIDAVRVSPAGTTHTHADTHPHTRTQSRRSLAVVVAPPSLCRPRVRLQIIIAELLKNNTSVERLDLARCRIADAGAVALAQALAENTRLEYLNLESNTFGEKGAPLPLAIGPAHTTIGSTFFFACESNVTCASRHCLRRRLGVLRRFGQERICSVLEPHV